MVTHCTGHGKVCDNPFPTCEEQLVVMTRAVGKEGLVSLVCPILSSLEHGADFLFPPLVELG